MAYSHFYFGLLALLAAQIPSFVVASQVYGDTFVLLLLGLLSGFALAVPDVAAAREPAVSPVRRAPLRPTSVLRPAS